MSKKILLDAGHVTNYNQSKAYKNYYEGNAMWTLQGLLKKELEAYGFTVKTTRTNRDKDIAVYDRGAMAKGYDMFISLHSNACDTESVDRVVVIKGYDQPDTLANKFGEELSKIMGVKQKHQIMTRKTNNGNEYYGVLRGAKAVGVNNRFLIEHSFHTNIATAKWLCLESNLKKIAQAEAKVIADFYGVKKTNGSTNGGANTPTNASTNDKIYRTVIFSGSYENAVKMKNEAISKGFKDCFIVEK